MRYADREFRYGKRRFSTRGGTAASYGGRRTGGTSYAYGRVGRVVDGRSSYTNNGNFNQFPQNTAYGGQMSGAVNPVAPFLSLPPPPPAPVSKGFTGPCFRCKKYGHKAYQCKEP